MADGGWLESKKVLTTLSFLECCIEVGVMLVCLDSVVFICSVRSYSLVRSQTRAGAYQESSADDFHAPCAYL